MARRRHLVVALANPGFRRLFAVRLACQFGDGVFQASLAGAVLFNPERQAHPADIAAGFAVLLLPYSVIGPFAGVLLDRWWRQRVLVAANVARALVVGVVAVEVGSGLDGLGFYATALVVLSLSRFVLSALSASLPHVVPRTELVTANAFATTAGTLATAIGGGVAIGARALIGDSNGDYALVAVGACVPYLVAAAVAAGFARQVLGPTQTERAARESAREVARGLRAGLAHIGATTPVRDGLLAIGVHRLGYGITNVCTLLLYRNYFRSDGLFRAGLAGLSQVVAAIAVGGALAAAVTPLAFRHVGAVRWPATVLLVAAGAELTLYLPFALPALLLAALVLAFVAQSIKISVDTLVQLHIGDEFRGRVFAVYDTLFNVALVTAAVLTALVLPETGHSPAAVIVIAVAYIATAIGYALAGSASKSGSWPVRRAQRAAQRGR